MDIEELKNKWKGLDAAPCKSPIDEGELVVRLAASRVSSSKDRIMRHLRTSGIAGVWMPFLACGLLAGKYGCPDWLVVVYSLYGLLMGVWALALLIRFRKHDFITMPVAQSLQHIVTLRRRISLMRAAGILGGVFIIGSLGMVFFADGDPYLTAGFFAGLAVGLPLGIFRWIDLNKRTRYLEKALRACAQP